MSKQRNLPSKPVFVEPSRLVWTEEKLAVLDSTQLGNLLDNIKIQLAAGRVSEETAIDLTKRIESRLPKRELTARRKQQEAAEKA